MRKFKVGDDVFLYEEKDRHKKGVRAKIERSTIAKINIGGSGGLVEFDGYTLANGTSSGGDNLYSLEDFQKKIINFME